MNAPRVLVIDDDADMRTLMAALLEHLGARVHAVGDAGALAAALAEPWDLALLDLVMPGNDHAECVAALASQAFRAPVCLLSGSGAQTLGEARAALDAAGLRTAAPLSKPARIDALAALLASLHPPAAPNPQS